MHQRPLETIALNTTPISLSDTMEHNTETTALSTHNTSITDT